ncbi:MAG: SDR family oxidoreductase [Candidatus Heimdallarchaeota archaeon]|nr:SDR family oxidoreductase [Candidatus Heimdallarchaeota archaeon]
MKRILITGASTGIGLGIAKALAEYGHTVFAGVRKQSDADKLSKFNNIRPLILDVENMEDITSAQTLLEKEGLDVLINNAGIGRSGALIEVSLEDMHKQFDVNVFAPLMMVQVMRDLLIDSKGHIITISSINGHVITPFLGPYVMSKFAVEAMDETLRAELKDFGVRVTTVNPGQYTTPIFHKLNDSLDEIAKNSIYYKDQLKKFNNFDPTKIGRDVSIIGEDLLKIINSENPPNRFISGTEDERKWVYDASIERLRDLLSNSSDKTIVQYLEEISKKEQ